MSPQGQSRSGLTASRRGYLRANPYPGDRKAPTMTGTTADLKSTLTEQHEVIKTKMQAVKDSSGERRQAEFDDLRRFLAAHEAAEEECIHSVAREDLGADAKVADQRIAEEDEAGQAIAELEKLQIDSEEFTTGFDKLTAAVIAHAEAEEHQELPLLDRVLDEQEVQRMLQALRNVPTIAASHADTGTPTFKDLLQAAKAQFHGPTAAH